MAAVRAQIGPRPGAGRRIIHELPDELVAREDQQVNIAPVVFLAAPKRAHQGHPGDRRVSLQQPEHVVVEAVTEPGQQRLPVRNSGIASGMVIHGHTSFGLPFRSPLLIDRNRVVREAAAP